MADIVLSGSTSGSVTLAAPAVAGSTTLTLPTTSGTVLTSAAVSLPVYTVGSLPAAGTAGRLAYVTDALAPTFLVAVSAGGAIKTPVFDNGTAWVAF